MVYNYLVQIHKTANFNQQMMNIQIYIKQATNISYRQIVTLMHESFQERLDKGLHYSCSSMTEEQFIEKSKKGMVFVAIDKGSNSLVGTTTLNIYSKNKKKVGYMEFVAIDNNYKHKGIGTMLLQQCQRTAKEIGASHILSDTSTKATSAVKWHLKNGFKIVGIESFRSTNYWSYVFRMQLEPSIIWNNCYFLKLYYLRSYLIIKLSRHIAGADTKLGKFFKKTQKICKN